MDNKKLMDEIDSLDGGENNKKSSKKGIGIVSLIAIIILTIIVFIVFSNINKEQRIAEEAMEDFKWLLDSGNYEEDYGYENDYIDKEYISEDEDTKIENAEEIDEEKAKSEIANIKIAKEFRDANKNLGIILNSQNPEIVIGILVQVIFYDGENKPIKIDESSINVLENNLDYYIVFEETPENFERYEFLITKEFGEVYVTNLRNDITFEVKDKNEDEIVITGKNNSKQTVEYLDFTLVYYDENDNILGVDYIYEYDVKKNGRFKLEEYKMIINDETYENIEYFRYDLILTSAYKYTD